MESKPPVASSPLTPPPLHLFTPPPLHLSTPPPLHLSTTPPFHPSFPRILILTSFGTANGIAHALEAGASGALVKTTENEDLVDAIRRVAKGETVISPELENMMRNSPPLPELSPRQQAILESMTEGLTSKEIGDKLGLKKDTIDKHINAFLRKTGAVSRTQAVAIALKKHLLKI